METKVSVPCKTCGVIVYKNLGHYNRSISLGAPFFCGKVCFGLSRRKHLSDEQKKANKAAYDKEYLAKNAERIKKKNIAYNESPAGRAMQKRHRSKRVEYHNEYCRTPEYVNWKKEYDREFKAKQNHGEFWESAIICEQINKKLIEMADKAELRTIQGTNNKSKRRKKQWLRLMKNLPQLT